MAVVVAIGCPGVLYAVVRTVMVEAHQAGPAADALGFEAGERYGFDGWYVGRREGRKVGVAAIHVRSYDVIRFRRFVEAGQVAVWVDHAPLPSRVVTVGGRVVGSPVPADEVAAMESWMAEHGEDLTLISAEEVDFADTGAALLVTWREASPDPELTSAWIDRLLPLARELER